MMFMMYLVLIFDIMMNVKMNLDLGWYTYDVRENCPIFKTPTPLLHYPDTTPKSR